MLLYLEFDCFKPYMEERNVSLLDPIVEALGKDPTFYKQVKSMRKKSGMMLIHS